MDATACASAQAKVVNVILTYCQNQTYYPYIFSYKDKLNGIRIQRTT